MSRCVEVRLGFAILRCLEVRIGFAFLKCLEVRIGFDSFRSDWEFEVSGGCNGICFMCAEVRLGFVVISVHRSA